MVEAKSCSSAFFERLEVDLLVAMGYGGSLADAGHCLRRGSSAAEGPEAGAPIVEWLIRTCKLLSKRGAKQRGFALSASLAVQT